MTDVFLSYDSEDRERVQPLVDAIQRAGFSVWWDREIGVGSRFGQEIERQLDDARCVVVAWSAHSVDSDWVCNEAQEGLDRGVLVPVLLDDIKPPLGFRRVHTARFDETRPNDSLAPVLSAIEQYAGARAPSVPGGQRAPAGRASLSAIAVMPFADLSPARDHGWLAEGIAEELTESLSRIRGLRIPARGATSGFKDKPISLAAIADQLGAGSLITGSVFATGNRVRVAAQWIRASDQSYLWSARFERTLEDAFALLREIAVGIAEAIRSELGIFDTAGFASRARYQTPDVRAWESFRKGFDLVNTFMDRKIIEGRELLRQALEIDPDYFEAQIWLAWSYLDDPEVRVEGARQALEKDPANPVALNMLVDDAITQWDFQTARQIFDHAVAHNPRDSLLTLKGYHLMTCLGELDEALAITRRGVRLDPLMAVHHYFLGLTHLNRGDAAAAIQPLERGIAVFEEVGDRGGIPVSMYLRSLSLAYQMTAREDDALQAMLSAYPPCRADISRGWELDRWNGMNAALAEALDRNYSGNYRRYLNDQVVVQLLACAGDKEHMYALLKQMVHTSNEFEVRDRKAYRICVFLAAALNSLAEFQPYRQEPHFTQLVNSLEERMARAAGTSGHAALL